MKEFNDYLTEFVNIKYKEILNKNEEPKDYSVIFIEGEYRIVKEREGNEIYVDNLDDLYKKLNI